MLRPVLAAQAAASGKEAAGGMSGWEPGRSCPFDYRYGAEALNRPPEAEAETLLVVGGLYGNPEALDAVLALYRAEVRRASGPVRLVFNGDCHWFDVDAAAFARINTAVARHEAIQGNVEAELAEASGAGCGCGYPPYVSQASVGCSNRIMARLRRVAEAVPGAAERFGAWPRHRIYAVGGRRVAVIHGDPDNLAGWRLAAESLAPADVALRYALGCTDDPLTTPQQVRHDLLRAGVSIFASTHTCLPVLQGYRWPGGEGAVVNNGSAGMPNFWGDPRGLITRIGVRPSGNAEYALEVAGLHCEALPVAFDRRRWLRRFEGWWPEGSPARAAYHERIRGGPQYQAAQAIRGFAVA